MNSNDSDLSRGAFKGLIGAVILVVIIVVLQGLFFKARQSELAEKAASSPTQQLITMKAGQLERLHGYRWVDQPRGVAAIPIERAMELVVRDSRRSPGAGQSRPGSGP